MRIFEEEHTGRGIGKCKGPGVGTCLVCLEGSRETEEAGVEGGGVSMGEIEVHGSVWLYYVG